MTFHWTNHSVQRMKERDLTREIVENTVKYPDRKALQRKGEHGGLVERYEKRVNQGTCVVVAERKKCDIWVTTCFWKS